LCSFLLRGHLARFDQLPLPHEVVHGVLVREPDGLGFQVQAGGTGVFFELFGDHEVQVAGPETDEAPDARAVERDVPILPGQGFDDREGPVEVEFVFHCSTPFWFWV